MKDCPEKFAFVKQETMEELVLRKAAHLRYCLIQGRLSISPNPDMDFDELPVERQQKWIALAQHYVRIFG